MSAALMNDLRESLLLERARKIYNNVAWRTDHDAAIDMIRDVLRITRDEGIETGLRQRETYSAELQKAAL